MCQLLQYFSFLSGIRSEELKVKGKSTRWFCALSAIVDSSFSLLTLDAITDPEAIIDDDGTPGIILATEA